MEVTGSITPTGVDKAPATQANPANPVAKRVTEATRIPMSVPTTKLAVPEIPGYFLYWHLGKNVNQAMRAGYTFVDDDEVTVEQHGLANDTATSGSTDMGTRISISAGRSQFDEQGNAERLYLMKLPNEFRAQDMKAMADINEGVARNIRGGTIDGGDTARYMKKGQDLFIPKNR